MRQYFLIDAQDPLILSEHNATEGNHSCLDYIPGSAVFGAIAAQLYPELEGQQSWQTFHAGGLKVGNFYPFRDGEIAYPMPFAWHEAKAKTKSYSASVANLTVVTRAEAQEMLGGQLKQKRSGYVQANSTEINVTRGVTTKTAIDESGSAKDGQLFNYQFIERGQQFLGWIEGEEETISRITKVLAQGARLGRSRNSEFGRVQFKKVSVEQSPSTDLKGKSLTLWCLSDLYLLNAQGQATVFPNLEECVPGVKFELAPSKSFVRTRKTSRFNQKRKGYDSEMLVVEKGSVFHYEASRELTENEVQKLTSLGLGREVGLGQVMVNPSWSTKEYIDSNASEAAFISARVGPTDTSNQENLHPSSSPLTRWVRAHATADTQEVQAKQVAEKMFKNTVRAYASVRGYNHTPAGHSIGPSKSQWGRVRAAVVEANSLDDLLQSLFESDHALCKAKNDEQGWGSKLPGQKQEITFAQWWKALLNNALHADNFRFILLYFVELMGQRDLSSRAELRKAEEKLGTHKQAKGDSNE